MFQDSVTGGRAWTTEDERNVKELHAACNRLRAAHGEMTFGLPFTTVLSLIATIQLALRHPRIPTATALQMRTFLFSLLKKLREDEPAMVRIMEKGFDVSCDVIIEENCDVIDFNDLDTAWGRFELVTEGGAK